MIDVLQPLESAALARPDHPVLVCGGRVLTACELRDAVAMRAAWLHEQGLRQHDVVGLIGPPSIEWVVAFHALGWLGARAAPVPDERPDHELQRLLDELRPRAILAAPGAQTSVDRAHRVLALEPLQPGAIAPLAEGASPLEQVRVLIFSSGTTGWPRLAELTTAQLLFSTMSSAIRLGHDVHDRWLDCLPLHHIGGLSILVRCAWLGTCVLLHERFDPVRVARELDSGAATLVSLVPTMLASVLDARPAVPFPGSLRAILVGGAPTGEPLLERCRAIGAPVALSWGMSETASQVATAFPGDLASGVGAPPLAFARVTAEDGRLCVAGPLVRAGEMTTSDLGRVDAAGRVHVSGRADDAILSGGEKIMPAEIEALLERHPAVEDVAVVAYPDERWGERPAAFVVRRRATSVDEQELERYCRQHLVSFKVPEAFYWCEQLPRSETGKVLRQELRELAMQRRGPSEAALAQAAQLRRGQLTYPDAMLHRLAQSSQADRLMELGTQLQGLRAWLAGDLDQIERQLADLAAADRDVAHRAAAHLLAQPGKRIRPLCVLIAGRLGDATPHGETRALLHDVAIACELVHAATLLHDDVIDLGHERRGAPAARMLFGNTASILAGDHLLTEALRSISSGGRAMLLQELLDVISQMIAAEALQLEQQHRFDPRPDLYLRVVEGKTAALFRWGLRAGAVLAELPAAAVDAAGDFGRHLGIAFQLVDDQLDLDGDPQRVGKDALADLREGKLTWPLLVAAQRDPVLAADLRRAADTTAEEVGAELVARIRATGALAVTRGLAAEYAGHALSALQQLPDSQARHALQAVVEFCLARVS